MARRDQLVEFWDGEAATYDTRSAWLERRFLRASRAWAGARARGATLDVAVGTGANLEHYTEQVRVTGVDWSPRMLAMTRARAAGLRRDIDLHQADATDLPFRDETFDSVVCTFALCSIDDEAAALRQMLRVLRPGGRLLLADHVVATSSPVRLAQRVVERFSAPRYNEHFTRRPLETLRGSAHGPDVTVVETQRLSAGAIERVHARRGPGIEA